MLKYRTLLLTLSFLSFTCLAGAVERKVIIGFKNEAALTEGEKHHKIHGAGGRLKYTHKLINAVSAQLPEEEIKKLGMDTSVAYIENDSLVGIIEPPVTAPLTQEYTVSWGVVKIGGNTAVAAGITGAGIKVAILDSGIDYSHPDLKDNYKGGYNFIYGNNDPFDDGYNSHGTHIAGIIGARNNGTGVVGVAPEVSLYAVKVLGGMVMGNLSDILAGMEWAISNQMDIINMSIGAPMDSAAFKEVCDRAYEAGIIVIAATGNSHKNIIEFPAAYESAIAVSATDQDDTLASFSNYGEKVELVAPGVNIRSTIRGGGYGSLSGTSQATAQVTGAAAIILAKKIADNSYGRVTDDVRTILASSAVDLGAPGRDQYFGFGRVDLTKAFTPPPETRWTYNITRTHASNKSEFLKVPLIAGSYTVGVVLNTLRELNLIATDGDASRMIEIKSDRHNHKQHAVSAPIDIDITMVASGSLVFIPEGKPGSSAAITITKK